ncbi:MAG TPA: Hsp70 family protein, partial [Gemmataceae bacterium]
MQTAFGIDFGTTNTRVAYFDGETVRVVPFTTRRGTVYQLPTAVAYQHGEPVSFGVEARLATNDQGTLFPEPLKWTLKSSGEVEVQGGTRDRADVVADFLKNLRRLVADSLPKAPLDRAAVTIPVHYPPTARLQLIDAFRRAGIEVTHVFFEPIAAIYAGLAGEPVSGVAAVFDWGGGSLDIATVQLRDGVALTREVDGWHRGGTDFDYMIAEQAVHDFLARHRDSPATHGKTAEDVLERTQHGRDLRLQAEDAKIRLEREPEVAVSSLRFMGLGALNYRLTRATLTDLIAPDLKGGMARLDRTLTASGVTPRTLARLFLSGGTCHVRDIREWITRQYGERLTATLRLPSRLQDRRAAG